MVGTALLQVPTTGVIVFNTSGELLLVRNADDGAWGIPGGLIEPYEQPADAAVREAWEETGLQIELTGIVGVFGGLNCGTVYPNGDKISWVATIFSGRPIGGDPRPDGRETTEVRFIHRDALPAIPCRPHVFQFLEAMALRPGVPFFANSTWLPPDHSSRLI